MVFDEEFLNSLPVLSEEELENNFWDPDEFIHQALQDFMIDSYKIDREYNPVDDSSQKGEKHELEINTDFEKVDYEKYRNSFSKERLEEFLSERGKEFSIEEVRALMYGYTFTDEYALHPETSVFDSEWWRRHTGDDSGVSLQEIRIAIALLETGNGRSPETAYCVIDIYQEYDIISLLVPKNTPLVTKQTLLEGCIDCLELEPNPYGVDKLYFDIHRRFEVGYKNKGNE